MRGTTNTKNLSHKSFYQNTNLTMVETYSGLIKDFFGEMNLNCLVMLFLTSVSTTTEITPHEIFFVKYKFEYDRSLF